MPPPIPATLLKAVIFPSSRHHPPPPPSPFIHGKQQHKPSRSTLPVAAPPRISAHARNAFPIKVSAAGGGKGWWMRPASARAPVAVPGEGWRRWVGGGGLRRGGSGSDKVGGTAAQSHVEGSIQQYRSEEGEAELGDCCQPPPPTTTRLITLPTVLTLGRVAAVPLLMITFYMNGWWATTATTGIFLAASITDWLDGYIARKMRLRTSFGAFLDPVADKLMVATALVLLCSRPLEAVVVGEVPWLLAVPSIAIIGREITMSAVREWAASQNSKVLEAVAVNKFGKWKTATQMTALTILLATRDPSLIGGTGVLIPTGVVLLYTSAGLGVWSLAVYVRKIWGILIK